MIQGCIGTVDFSVSAYDVFTWRSMERKSETRFGEHSVLEGTPRLQHVGRALDSMTLSVVMDANLPGALPCEERIKALRALAVIGEELPLVFGAVYQGLWVITAVNVTGRRMRGDRILAADVTLELKEYN